MGILDNSQPLNQQSYTQPYSLTPPPMMASPNVPSPDEQDFFRFRIESLDILEEVQHQLRGEVWDDKTRQFVPKFRAWANEEGISTVLSLLYSCGINKNIIMGCLQHDEIYIRMNYLMKELSAVIMKNYSRYGIDKTKRTALVLMIVQQIHSALSRSEDGREADQLSTASQRMEHFMHEDRPKPQANPLASLFQFGRR